MFGNLITTPQFSNDETWNKNFIGLIKIRFDDAAIVKAIKFIGIKQNLPRLVHTVARSSQILCNRSVKRNLTTQSDPPTDVDYLS
ncbi:hypothetical protein ACN4EK_18200 [Pantanalinema rosaneae CENA516]|uniref:hypothetical protein n=1 Tax=Pantanalinema rosaneae TaxID=1620701 RepID=UPI003D6E6B84